MNRRLVLFDLFLLGVFLFGVVIWQTGTAPAQTETIAENFTFPYQGETWTLIMPTDRITSELSFRMAKKGVVFRCSFGRESDINEDNWPDGWIRHEGVGFPKYYHEEMEIVKQRTLMGNQFFRIRVRRGSAAVFSPRIPALQGMTYSASVYSFANQLINDKVFISLSLLDSEGKVIKTAFSEPVGNTEGWYQLNTSSIVADSPAASSVALGLHVQAGERQDLQGLVGFAQVMIKELPTVRFDTARPWNLFPGETSPVVSGSVSMVSPTGEPAILTLLDPFDKELAKQAFPVATTGSSRKQQSLLPSAQEKKSPPPATESGDTLPEVITVPFSWQPPIDSPGFYRIRVFVPSILPASGNVPTDAHGETTFVFLAPLKKEGRGSFGWTLPNHLDVDDLKQLKPLLEQAGLFRVKVPVRLPEDAATAKWSEMVEFFSWLAKQGITPVGLLSDFPQKSGKMESMGNTGKNRMNSEPVAYILSQPLDVWFPPVEMTMLRLGMLVPDWQFGSDHDRSMQSIIALDQWIKDVKAKLDEKGLNVAFGFPWDWVYQFPVMPSTRENPRWGFLALGNDFSLTEEDLEYYLGATRDQPVRRFVTLEPLDVERYPLKERIRDLVLRMVTAENHGAEGVFLSPPLQESKGGFREDRTPMELFLPWRTTAILTGGKQLTPSIGLPKSSRNFCYRNKDESADIFMLWNDGPTREILNFGKNATIIDLWGKESPMVLVDFQQSVDVGPLPVFVVGADPRISKIRQNCRLEGTVIPGTYDQKHPNKIILNNPFSEALSGTMEFVPPEGVLVDPPVVPFTLAPGETLEKQLALTLTPVAMSGDAIFQTKISLEGPDHSVFGVYQEIFIGITDLSIELSTRINHFGQLEVHQAFINNSSEIVNFSSTLYTPDRPIQKIIISRMGFGRRDHTYIVENGAELIGKPIRIVAREINGKRALKYQIMVRE